jgi:hypothetical protein
MFGSKPFMFKLPTSESRLNEGAPSTSAAGSVAVVWRAYCFSLSILLGCPRHFCAVSFDQGGRLRFARRRR